MVGIYDITFSYVFLSQRFSRFAYAEINIQDNKQKSIRNFILYYFLYVCANLIPLRTLGNSYLLQLHENPQLIEVNWSTSSKTKTTLTTDYLYTDSLLCKNSSSAKIAMNARHRLQLCYVSLSGLFGTSEFYWGDVIAIKSARIGKGGITSATGQMVSGPKEPLPAIPACNSHLKDLHPKDPLPKSKSGVIWQCRGGGLRRGLS